MLGVGEIKDRHAADAEDAVVDFRLVADLEHGFAGEKRPLGLRKLASSYAAAGDDVTVRAFARDRLTLECHRVRRTEGCLPVAVANADGGRDIVEGARFGAQVVVALSSFH